MRGAIAGLAALALAACAAPQGAQRLNDDGALPLPAAEPFRPVRHDRCRRRVRMPTWLSISWNLASSWKAAARSRSSHATKGRCGSSCAARCRRGRSRSRPADRSICAPRPGSTSPARPATAPPGAEHDHRRIRLAPRHAPGVPTAACFVVPNVDSWDDFLANRRNPALDWTRVARRVRTAVFIPLDTTPQENPRLPARRNRAGDGAAQRPLSAARQRLQRRQFPDHADGFDMLILRAWHAPELRPGMAPEEVAARLPAILDRLNPAGAGRVAAPGPDAARLDRGDRDDAGRRGQQSAQRRAAAQRALAIAGQEGWRGPRLALSLLLAARLAPPDEGEGAFIALCGGRDLSPDAGGRGACGPCRHAHGRAGAGGGPVRSGGAR
jgi:hypothetical protein